MRSEAVFHSMLLGNVRYLDHLMNVNSLCLSSTRGTLNSEILEICVRPSSQQLDALTNWDRKGDWIVHMKLSRCLEGCPSLSPLRSSMAQNLLKDLIRSLLSVKKRWLLTSRPSCNDRASFDSWPPTRLLSIEQVLYQCHDIMVIADYLKDKNLELQFLRTLWGAVRDEQNELMGMLTSLSSQEPRQVQKKIGRGCRWDRLSRSQASSRRKKKDASNSL